mgnify:CR=1 FL=1
MRSKSTVVYYVMPYMAGLLFALVMTYVPASYRGYIFWGYFIALLLVMGATSILQRRKMYRSEVVGEVRRSPVLMRVSRDEVMKLFMEDPKASEEMSKQMRNTLFLFVPSLFAMALFFLFLRLLSPPPGETGVGVFIRYLIIYETPIAISQSFNIYIRRKRRFEIVNTVLEYEVHTKGIVGRGVAIPFPLKDYSVNVDYARRFVELVPTSRSPTGTVRLRFYAKDVDRLSRIIKSRGMVGGKADKTST